jgi:hypothetical protein
MRIHILAVCCLAGLAGIARGEGEAHSLNQFQRVVIADDALPVQQAAAEELADYVGRMTGRKISIVAWSKRSPTAEGLSFFVGEGPSEKILGKKLGPWKQEEWLLQNLPEGLILAGHDGPGTAWARTTPAGTMLAAYTLLDDYLGVRWFWPGPFGEHVPHRPDALIPSLSLRQTPAFEIRAIQMGYPAVYHTKQFSHEAEKWSRRARLAWVRSAVFGHSWGDAFQLRTGETFKAHPEWFALVNGKRNETHMCTTTPEVIEGVVQYVLKGKYDIMNISPSDGYGFCECERCRALDVPGVVSYDKKHPQISDRIFTYANEVARRVREQNPEKGCGMLAYTFYHLPPVKLEKIEPNIYLSFAYQCAGHRDPEVLKEWRESVAGWKKFGTKLVIREGWGAHYWHDMNFLHYRQIIANLAEGRKLGFIGAYGEGTKNFAGTAPNYWALTRMMWDPDRDANQVMPDFYRDAYGPVAAEMEAFFETYQNALDQNWAQRDRTVETALPAYNNVIGAWGRLIPTAALEKAEQHLRDAEAKAPAGEYADRVKFHRFGHDYTRVMLGLLNDYRELAQLGLELEHFSTVVQERRSDAAERERILKRAYELGEKREAMLLAHRDWAGPDEGMYAYTNDVNLRQWHTAVKRELKIDRPTALTKKTLAEK